MAWISLVEGDIESRLNGTELTAVRTSALASGQEDPTEGVLAEVTELVRGYVAGYGGNVLGEAGTIPDELKGAALDVARHRLISRLPDEAYLTEARELEYAAALRLLERVAAGRVRVARPETAGTEEIGDGTIRVGNSRSRRAGPGELDGL